MTLAQPRPLTTWLDRAIGWVSPLAGMQRQVARQSLDTMLGGYDAARQDKAAFRTWHPRGLSPDAAFLPDSRPLRARSADLARNAPLAKGAIETNVTAVVGSGLTLQAELDRDVLGLSDAQASEIEEALEKNWEMWGETVEADLQRRLPEADQQAVVLRAVMESGDVFTVLEMRSRPGSDFELKTHLIDGARVSNPNFLPEGNRWRNGNRIVGGIEIDGDAAPVAIHVTEYPASLLPGSMTWQRTPIFGTRSGLRQVLHHYVALNPDQTRGVPYLAPVIELVKQCTRYSNSEVAGAVTASFFTVFVKSAPATPLGGVTGPGGQAAAPRNLELGPAAIANLRPDESIEIADPSRPNADFDGFMLAMAREIGAALEIPLPFLLKTFTGSYSVMRASILDFHRTTVKRQKWLVRSRQAPLYAAVTAEAVAKGWLTLPGFFEDAWIRKAWLGAQWVGDPQGQLDPVNETKAAGERVELGLSTLKRESIAVSGQRWNRMHPQRAKEHAARAADRLEPEVAGRSSTSHSVSTVVDERDSRDERDAAEERENA